MGKILMDTIWLVWPMFGWICTKKTSISHEVILRLVFFLPQPQPMESEKLNYIRLVFRAKTTATYRVDTNLGQTSSVGASSGSWTTRRHTNSSTLETDSDTAV